MITIQNRVRTVELDFKRRFLQIKLRKLNNKRNTITQLYPKNATSQVVKKNIRMRTFMEKIFFISMKNNSNNGCLRSYKGEKHFEYYSEQL